MVLKYNKEEKGMSQKNVCALSFTSIGIGEKVVELIIPDKEEAVLISLSSWEKNFGRITKSNQHLPLKGGGVVISSIRLEDLESTIKQRLQNQLPNGTC